MFSFVQVITFTVQEGQAVVLDIFPSEFDVFIRWVDVFGENLHLLGFDFDPCVVHISEPVAWCCSSERVQGLVFYLFHL